MTKAYQSNAKHWDERSGKCIYSIVKCFLNGLTDLLRIAKVSHATAARKQLTPACAVHVSLLQKPILKTFYVARRSLIKVKSELGTT